MLKTANMASETSRALFARHILNSCGKSEIVVQLPASDPISSAIHLDIIAIHFSRNTSPPSPLQSPLQAPATQVEVLVAPGWRKNIRQSPPLPLTQDNNAKPPGPS